MLRLCQFIKLALFYKDLNTGIAIFYLINLIYVIKIMMSLGYGSYSSLLSLLSIGGSLLGSGLLIRCRC
jgi:hypothetical protein